MTITLRLFSSFISCSFLFGANLNAQSAWLPPNDGNSVSIEVYRLDNSSRSLDINGTALFVNARYQAKAGVAVLFELPIAHSEAFLQSNFFFFSSESAQTTYGNPYLGVSFGKNESFETTLDIGLRLPLAPNNDLLARIVGSKSDFDRSEAFVSKLWSLQAQVGRRWSASNNLIEGWFKGGTTLLIPTGRSDVELVLDYKTAVWFSKDNFIFGPTFVGRTLLTNTRKNVFDNSEFWIGLGANATFGSFQPGLNLRFPLRDKLLNAVYGINGTFLFGRNE